MFRHHRVLPTPLLTWYAVDVWYVIHHLIPLDQAPLGFRPAAYIAKKPKKDKKDKKDKKHKKHKKHKKSKHRDGNDSDDNKDHPRRDDGTCALHPYTPLHFLLTPGFT
jgi:ABC-type Zn2+ transport system substrate-binding protein/surface adhesin